MGPLVSALLCGGPRVFSPLLPFVRAQRSVDHAQAWGRDPATRVRGRMGSVGTTPPSDGIIRPCARQLMRQEEITSDEENSFILQKIIIVVYMSCYERFLHPFSDAFCATDRPSHR